jgi:DNA-binding protein WhiA
MSFSSDVKTELCRDGMGKKCCALAEVYGVLLYANYFSPQLIRIVTENAAFAHRLPKLFRRAFGLSFDQLPPEGHTGRYTLAIQEPDKLHTIFSAFGYDPARTVSHHINLVTVENDCDKVAFLRGAFLAGGSVTDPTKRYHLELVTGHASVCRETHALLLEMGFAPKDSLRGSHHVTYFKQSSAIEDFLTTIGASVSAMELMQTKVEKHMANAMNRLTNCDMANADKITDAAQQQLEAIRAIEAGPGLEVLPPALQDTALLRIANPSCSLSDLAQLAYPPVTKSCMNHRLRKLMEYAQTLSD